MEEDILELDNLKIIALLIDYQTFDERMEFATWLAGLDQHDPDYIASALSGFRYDYDWSRDLEIIT